MHRFITWSWFISLFLWSVSGEDAVAIISAGSLHTCAVVVHGADRPLVTPEDVRINGRGHVHCWGEKNYGQALIPREVMKEGGNNWIAVNSGYYHTCGVYRRRDGSEKMVCWGDNGVGCAEVPDEVNTLLATEGYESILAGEAHSCLHTAAGTLTCWGDSESGVALVLRPSEKKFVSDLRSVCLGSQHMCAITRSGEMICWGKLWTHDAVASAQKPHQILEAGATHDFFMVSCGKEHTCAIDNDKSLFCFGRDDYSQSSIPDVSSVPDSGSISRKYSTGRELMWHDVCVGCLHTCGVLADGRLFCWGANEEGQLAAPQRYTTQKGAVVGVTCGCWHTCVRTLDGKVDCFGLNDKGQMHVPKHFHDNGSSFLQPSFAILTVVISAMVCVGLA